MLYFKPIQPVLPAAAIRSVKNVLKRHPKPKALGKDKQKTRNLAVTGNSLKKANVSLFYPGFGFGLGAGFGFALPLFLLASLFASPFF